MIRFQDDDDHLGSSGKLRLRAEASASARPSRDLSEDYNASSKEAHYKERRKLSVDNHLRTRLNQRRSQLDDL